MKKFFFLSLLVFTKLSLCSQVGQIFPSIQGKTLEDKAIVVPAKNNKYSVVAIAFNRQAEDDLKKWLNPLFQTFIKDEKESSKGMDLADVYDVNFVFIPMIMGFKRMADEFKKDTDPQFWKYIMDTEKTDINLLQKNLKVDDYKVPYFFVLDAGGKVLEMQSGKFLISKLDKLEDAVE